ncbi:MAG: hypothetical protein IJN25_03250 [Clostridia bacterium]|nr:hypothetical protein [Clostridia bacterium]
MKVEQFWNPPASFRSAPFWAWNGKLEKEKLAEQIEAFHQMGFGGFFMHVRCGLITPYLGEEFMEMVRFCASEAEKRGMYAHLYDEDRYPSGHCGGQVTAERRFMGREIQLHYKPIEGAMEENAAIESGGVYLVGRYDIDFTPKHTMRNFVCLSEGEKARHTEVWIYSVCLPSSGWFNGANHPDVLNPEVTTSFIEKTHEKYKAAVGDAFGKAIPSIFTDEPNVGHMGWFETGCQNPYSLFWTPRMPEIFEEKYGFSLLETLPAVFFNAENGETGYIRYAFLDLTAALFKEGYSDQVGAWCEKNDLEFTGHFHSEGSLGGQCCTSVDLLRQYAAYHIPGIDMLDASVELTTAKQAMSAVHQYGRKEAMTELYGASRWSCDFRRYKMQTDWQTAMGFTKRVPHLAFYSMEGESKRDYPASIGLQSPWYKEFAQLEDHFARTAWAMAEGRAVVKIAVVHPIESYWMAFGTDDAASGERKRLNELHKDVAEWLCRNHLDYDYLSEALLPQLWDGEKVGEMQYEVIVVPGCTSIRKSTADILWDFKKRGGRVIFMGDCPIYSGGRPTETLRSLYEASVRIPCGQYALTEALEAYRTVEIRRNKNNFNPEGAPAGAYVYGMRETGNGGWLMIAEAAPKPNYDSVGTEKLFIRIRGEYAVCLYNTLEGRKEKIKYRWEDGWTCFEKEVHPMESLLVRLGEEAEGEAETAIRKSVTFGEEARYSLSEENVLVLDVAEYALDDAPFEEKADIFELTDILCKRVGMEVNRGRYTQPYCRKKSEEHTLRLRYRFYSAMETNAALALEFPYETEIYLGGKKIENNPEGYYIDRAIHKIPGLPVQKGENILEITMPFTDSIQPQVMYLLGDFGVSVKGTRAEIVPKEESLFVGDVSRQGLPFYGGNISYTFEVETEKCTAAVECSFFRAAALHILVDGEDGGLIFAPPYRSRKLELSKGKHTVTVTALGTRENTLAPLHAVKTDGWYAYWQYRPADNARSDGYRPSEVGLLKRPRLVIF